MHVPPCLVHASLPGKSAATIKQRLCWPDSGAVAAEGWTLPSLDPPFARSTQSTAAFWVSVFCMHGKMQLSKRCPKVSESIQMCISFLAVAHLCVMSFQSFEDIDRSMPPFPSFDPFASKFEAFSLASHMLGIRPSSLSGIWMIMVSQCCGFVTGHAVLKPH